MKEHLCDSNALQVYVSGFVNKSSISVVYLRYSGWVDLFQHDISLSKTYLTDPGCHNADVVGFTLYFGNYNYFSGNWQPVEVPAYAYGQNHDGMLFNVASGKSDVTFCGGEASVKKCGVFAEQDHGFQMEGAEEEFRWRSAPSL